MFIFLIILLQVGFLVGSENDIESHEKEFTFERITNFIDGTAMITSILRLKNNYTQDIFQQDKQYVLNKNQSEIIIEQVGGAGYTSILRSPEAYTNQFLAMFTGVAKFYLRENTKPNFSVSFNLNEIPVEEIRHSKRDYFSNFSDDHVVEFLREYIASNRNQINKSKFYKCLRLIQECSIQ